MDFRWLVLLEEPPLHIVQDAGGNLYFDQLCDIVKDKKVDYEPLWYWFLTRKY